ncbi:hypothetical protein L0Z72_15280 [candidate division KSB1 bacterium]|nr:hypothetical protein [candidate division KSB1 bacterium]
MRNMNLLCLSCYLILCLSSISCSSLMAGENKVVFYRDDLEDGKADQWELGKDWKMETDTQGNHFLTAIGHQYASYTDRKMRGRYVFSCAVLIRKGGIRLHYLVNKRGRYVITLNSNSILLSKEMADGSSQSLRQVRSAIANEIWNVVEIKIEKSQIEVRLNNISQFRHLDRQPFLIGFPAIETLLDSDLSIDNISLSVEEPVSNLVIPNIWYPTGGPSGGVGYDIRIHPRDHNIIIVTDVLSGINKSSDGGATWAPKNTGILDRKGPTEDAIPIFSLTIDPNHPHIIWAGCQYSNGIYRSHDTGETWEKRNHGVEASDRISVRGFAVHPQDSNTVIAAAQIQSYIPGRQFELSYGVFYKTTDGGLNWRRIEGDSSLNRVVIYHPTRPDILYCSTGIFDAEALNSNKSKVPPDPGGAGVLKNFRGGEGRWVRKNYKLTNLHIGFLEMNPKNPDILYAAGYSDIWKDILPGHIFRTNDGGETWQQLSAGGREGDSFTVITVAPSDTNCVYAASHSAFYSSLNGGKNWHKLWRAQEETWGPEGLLIGFPISIAVHPTDKLKVYINNYGGGAFISEDGGETWKNSSAGYSGADIRALNVDPLDSDRIFVAGRSGPFHSEDKGANWTGIAKGLGIQANYTMTLFPHSSTNLLASGDDHFTIVKSNDSGNTWVQVFPDAGLNLPEITTDFISTIAIAPQNPKIIYAGARKTPGIGSFEPSPIPSVGIFRSIDGGKTWDRFNEGLDDTQNIINNIAVHPGDPNTAWASIYQHGIFKTQSVNGRFTWLAKNNGLQSSDIRCIAVNPNNPDILYAGSGDGGGLFKSTNGGDSWDRINNGIRINCPTYLSPIGKTTFGLDFNKYSASYFASYYPIDWTKILDIVLDPTNPDRIYICDLSSGVYVTTDGGAHWALMNEGLINRAVVCLDISSDGKVLYAGTYGAGVYRMQITTMQEGS